MADQPNLDPTSLWRDMLGQWDRSIAAVTSQTAGAGELGRAMQQMSAISLRMQEASAEMVAKSLQALNLPSRTELLALHERLDRIETALSRLSPNEPSKTES